MPAELLPETNNASYARTTRWAKAIIAMWAIRSMNIASRPPSSRWPISGRQAVKQRALDAFSGKRCGAHLSFASADLLWKVLEERRHAPSCSLRSSGSMVE